MPSSNPTAHAKFSLGGGSVNVRLRRTVVPVGDLCDFALRNNPNRAVLVVSRVAGRHIPVRPSQARWAFHRLAQQIPADLPRPVVVIGLCESAIGLGHGVYDEYVRITDAEPGETMFIHSSRHRLDKPVAVLFEEEHSHATQEYLYLPDAPEYRRLFAQARSVVIVDDELTTGKTVQNLACRLRDSMPQLECLVIAALNDWRKPELEASFGEDLPFSRSQVVSLVAGEISYEQGDNPPVVKMPALVGNGQHKDHLVSASHGRLGVQGSLTLRSEILRQVSEGTRLRSGRCLVLATEEFAYPPLLLAEELERNGMDVVYQSTTRTPVLVGKGAMRCAMTFTDNYGDGISNFAYNVAPGMYSQVFLCHETPSAFLDRQLVEALDAQTVRFV